MANPNRRLIEDPRGGDLLEHVLVRKVENNEATINKVAPRRGAEDRDDSIEDRGGNFQNPLEI